MLSHITMPDGKNYTFDEILDGEYPQELPAPLAYVRYMYENERNDRTHFHVTDFLQGHRKTILERRHDYAKPLEAGTYNISGSLAHFALDNSMTGEKAFVHKGVKMTPDLLEEQDEELVLTDHKHQGSYAIAKFLGLEKHEVPVEDENGNPVYYKTGKKAGQQKTRTEFRQGERNTGRYAYQLNSYRVAIEAFLESDQVTGTPYEQWAYRSIDRMKVFFIPRDGGTHMARANGIEHRMYYEDVPFIGDEEINRWLTENMESLHEYEREGTIPPPCSPEEAWNGRMCESFCPVADLCVACGDNPYLDKTDSGVDLF